MFRSRIGRVFLNFQTCHCNCFVEAGQNSIRGISLRFSDHSFISKKLVNDGNTNNFLNKTSRSLFTLKKNSGKSMNNVKKSPKEKENIIYYGTLTSQVRGAKAFTLVLTLGATILQPLIIQRFVNSDHFSFALILMVVGECLALATPIFLHLFTKSYVTEIRYDAATDTYTATTLSFFLRKVNIEFKCEDVSVSPLSSVLSTMTIKGKPVFVNSDTFLSVEHYIRMKGYDKPIDFKLSAPVSALDNLGSEKNEYSKKSN